MTVAPGDAGGFLLLSGQRQDSLSLWIIATWPWSKLKFQGKLFWLELGIMLNCESSPLFSIYNHVKTRSLNTNETHSISNQVKEWILFDGSQERWRMAKDGLACKLLWEVRWQRRGRLSSCPISTFCNLKTMPCSAILLFMLSTILRDNDEDKVAEKLWLSPTIKNSGLFLQIDAYFLIATWFR